MRVTFKCFSDRSVPLDVAPDETVFALATRVSDALGFEPASLRLFFAGRILRDASTAASCAFIDGALVHVVWGAHPGELPRVRRPLPPTEPLEPSACAWTEAAAGTTHVVVQKLDGSTVDLALGASDTTLDAKRQVEAKTGIPVDLQRLTFGGVQLGNDVVLVDHVPDGSTFVLVTRLRGD